MHKRLELDSDHQEDTPTLSEFRKKGALPSSLFIIPKSDPKHSRDTTRYKKFKKQHNTDKAKAKS